MTDDNDAAPPSERRLRIRLSIWAAAGSAVAILVVGMLLAIHNPGPPTMTLGGKGHLAVAVRR